VRLPPGLGPGTPLRLLPGASETSGEAEPEGVAAAPAAAGDAGNVDSAAEDTLSLTIRLFLAFGPGFLRWREEAGAGGGGAAIVEEVTEPGGEGERDPVEAML
jgi:hypothetical protein